MSDMHHAAPEPEHPLELFVEFVNTLEFDDGRPIDHVEDPSRLAEWLTVNGAARSRIPRSRVERAMPAFRELRELMRSVVVRLADGSHPTPGQVRRLNAVLRTGLHYDQLRPDNDNGGSRYAIAQVGDELDQARAAIAGSLAHYLADHDVSRLRVCGDDGCRWLFVDHSPAGRRRWCDMRTCGNRAKVARHRARAKADAGGPPTPTDVSTTSAEAGAPTG